LITRHSILTNLSYKAKQQITVYVDHSSGILAKLVAY